MRSYAQDRVYHTDVEMRYEAITSPSVARPAQCKAETLIMKQRSGCDSGASQLSLTAARPCSVPKKELDAAQVALVEVQSKLAAALVAAKERRGELTPRPAWAKLRKGAGGGAHGATAEQAAELCALTARLTAEVDGLREEAAQARVTLANLTERLRESDCLAPPDVAVLPEAARSIEELPGSGGKEPDRFKVTAARYKHGAQRGPLGGQRGLWRSGCCENGTAPCETPLVHLKTSA